MITCSSYGSVPRVYANTNFYQIREIESLSEQVLYQKVPYGTRYQDLEMPDSIDVFVSGGGQNEDVPDTGTDENVVAFANRTDDDAVLEKLDSEENGEKEDTEGKDTEGKDAGENSKDKSEGEEGLEKAESGSGEQGDSGKDGNSAENGDSQDENVNPGNGESDEKDDSGKTDSGSSGGNADLNEDGSSSNGKTDQPKEDVKTDEKTEEEIGEKEGFWRKVKVRWVLDAEESQASRYDGENPGIYLFRAELKSSNYEVDEDELPVIQITVLEEEQVKTTLEFAPLEESIIDQILPLGSKESDIQFPETLTVRETTGEETTERTLSGITWKLDEENSDYSEFQGGLAPEDYFDCFDEDGEPEETEEKTWEGYDKANEEYNGAIYTYIPVIPESEEIPEDTALPEIHVQAGDAGIALYADEGITGSGTEADPYVICTAEQWSKVMGKNQRNQYNGNSFYGVSKYIKLGADIDLSGESWESRTLTTCLDGDGYALSGISQPLFSVLKGTVKNLILSDVKIEGNGNQGAIAETVGDKATVEKCYVSGSIAATGNSYSGAGGLIGAVQTTNGAPLTIENCVVNADITGKTTSLAGGLIGYVSSSNVVTIKKCIAMGTVSTVEDKGSGGLVGGPNRTVTIKNSVALQEEVSTKSLRSYVDRIFGYAGDYKVHVIGEHNFAYQDMKVKYGDKLLDKAKDELELNYGVSVSKTDLLTTNFWENTIGWRSDTENWKFDDKRLPTLKMKRSTDNKEVEIFSGTDIPDYLEATETKTGSVKSGETGIADAEITFKKGSSEKKVATDSEGTFRIELANGVYDVTLKKTGYLTVRTTVTISDADSEALNFTMKTNPVSMPSGQTVTGTFQTTDADAVTADGEIALTYTGDENLRLEDFKLSSEEDGTAYDGVTLFEVNTENGTGSIKIQFAKSLDLGNTNEITLYVHYKGSSIGSIVLKKEVNLVQLEAPAEVKWDETVKGKAVWSPVAKASGYEVQLYKNGSALGDLVTLGADAVSHDFTAQIAESGTYTFGVRATGDGLTYGDSEEAKSGTYEFSEQTLEDVKTAARAALQAMTVTNATTANEILQVVQNVITNQKIHADWSAEEGFHLTPATDGKEPGQNGSITGTIVLSYTSEDASTKIETIEINLPIAAKYAITFTSGRKDSQGEAPTLENAAAGTVITLPENTFKVYGMNFKGWSDGTNTYASGAGYTMPERNVAFEAVWVQDQWDGQAVVEPAKDENGYYQISTGAELAYFRDTNSSNWKAKLMCDIDMGGHDFAPINQAGAEFDGCGHTIQGLNVVGDAYVGLFRAISSNCEIKNLTIENAVVKASGDKARVGILVGDVYGSLTVENCYVSGTIETADGTNKIESAGGLIGNVREYSNYSVNIKSCYADAKIKGTTDKGFAGGLVGWTGGTTTIDNSYAVVDMDVDKGYYIGGLVGSGNVTISHSYAAGETLTKNPTGASVAGISSNGSISSCVSIFPEMRSLNRIGGRTGSYQNNYGFAGTVARKSDGMILTPEPDMMGADKLYGADAAAADLKNPAFYKGLGWDFDSTWMMDSTGEYAFPILKNQTLRPDLTLDLTPSVTGITLDKTNETIYPRGSVQLTATVDVANGASREVTWKSSDPAVKVEDGLVTAADVANGTYIITAISKADPSKQAECQLTVDTAEHTVTVGRENTINSLNAVVKAYASLDDAKKETNPISTIGSETGTFTFSRKAGEKVYLAFTGLDPKDVVSEVTITGENNSKVNATICNLENPTVYCFTMPCSDASVQVSYAENMNAYQYTWFVGQEWGTWGTTAAFETEEWSGGDHIGSLKVTKIINGKLFKEFKIKSMSLYKKDSVTPKKVNRKADLNNNGDYCIETDDTTGLPTLYVYLDGPGMVAVDIEVKDDPSAVFSITKKPESSSYYTLDKTTANAGKQVTATLTDEGVRRMKENPNKNACLTYSGGLLVVIYPPKFTESDGKWTASFKMPAQDVETHVYFGDKDKVTLNGTDKEVDYDGTPKSVGDGIQATIGGQDLSEQFLGQYEVYYKGVNGTVYSSTTPPTNAGTYSCKIKIPDSNVSYMSDPITVQLTIKKIATKTPKAPQAAAWTDTSVTLKATSAFVDGTAIPAGYELEYCVDQGEWQDSPLFTGLTPETTYNFYVRLKEGVNTTASAASEAVAVQTKKASSDPSDPTKPDPSNPTPSTPGNPQGTATSGRDRSTSTWVKESAGWRYRLSNGTYLSGSLVLDPATGRQVEQVVWKQLRGAWWAFGADGYIRTGWVYDYSAGKWYYVDENTGMRTGWYLDPQDGRWYYLDPVTGEMLTEWQLIPDLGYVYLNPYAPQPTWAYDEALKTWVYMEGAGRPYGSLYMAEWTPDGYYVNADGVWEPAR